MLTVKESQKNFIKLLILFVAIITPWVIGFLYVENTQNRQKAEQVKLVNYKKDTTVKADHSKFEILQQHFDTPQDVTRACLSCHNLTDRDFMHTTHWKWTRDYVTDAGDTIQFGKKNAVNNFCIGISSNEPRCTSCHAGYGWKDHDFDFSDADNIDCLVCHDRTGTYKKFPSAAGYPVKEPKKFGKKTFYPPDYNKIAQNVGAPKRENCGTCHYTGGGGNNVKHGDLALELNNTTKEIDVHMAADGADMSCVDCHKTDAHVISGKMYSVSSTDVNRVTCEQCHTGQPHKNTIINRHTKKVACETCHIPQFAKGSATKMYWDWSKAGKFRDNGSVLIEKDSAGNMTYHSFKGSFVWKKNVVPEYVWFNGTARHYLPGMKIDTSQVVQLNTLLGSYSDKKSRIIPVKVHRGRQIYDKKNNILIIPHLFGKDSTAYWKNFDWNLAAETGMKSANLPYSGEYGFVSTEMYWPVNHMVAPMNESLTCKDCHARNSRLNGLTDFYLPGRDKSGFLDWLGIGLLAFAFIGVMIHALLRISK